MALIGRSGQWSHEMGVAFCFQKTFEYYSREAYFRQARMNQCLSEFLGLDGAVERQISRRRIVQ